MEHRVAVIVCRGASPRCLSLRFAALRLVIHAELIHRLGAPKVSRLTPPSDATVFSSRLVSAHLGESNDVCRLGVPLLGRLPKPCKRTISAFDVTFVLSDHPEEEHRFGISDFGCPLEPNNGSTVRVDITVPGT